MPWTSSKGQLSIPKTTNASHTSLKVSPTSVERPSTSHMTPEEVKDCFPEIPRSKSVGSFGTLTSRSTPRNVTPKSGGRHSSRSALPSTPSPTRENLTRVNRGKDRIKKVTPRKVKVKRSIQEIFRKREVRQSDGSISRTMSKRSSNTGSSFAQRFKDSTSFSKTNPPRSLDPTLEAQQNTTNEGDNHTEESNRNMALSALEAGSSSTAPSPPVQSLTETAKVINNIVDRVTCMEKSSPDRLIGVEIAEVCNTVYLCTLRLVLTTCFKQAVLRTLELYQKARQSADIAKKHARQAELSVTRASVEVNKLQRLCTPELDVKTLQAIKDLVRSAELDIPKTSKLS
jgi:hypothetical protein